MEWSGVVRDSAVHREAAEGTKWEGHGGLAGRPILGEGRLNRKTGELENDGIYWQYYVGVALLRQE
jgi:hypothetical protein